MNEKSNLSLVDIFRDTGLGTRVYAFTDGSVRPVTFAGFKKAPDGEHLLFTSKDGLVETGSEGERDGKPYVFPSQDTAGNVTEWEAVKNLMSLQADIITKPVGSADELDHYILKNSSYRSWWRKVSSENPGSVTGRLMGRFVLLFDARVENLKTQFPKPVTTKAKPVRSFKRGGNP